MRAGQPFAMRYPLVEVEGSYGTLLSSGSWSAPRYTASRLSKLAEYLFADIKKEVIEEWRDNYDNTEQYPSVLPSKGFYNLVNGTFGLGVGASSSIPQYNLKELNNALITLIQNPNCSFDEIYCVPDFATGAILINPNEVKESHKKGTGFACKLRAAVEWNSKERCFIVKEIPYMLYTETICRELENIINSEDNFGIDRFNDLTGESVNIKIYLTKNANPDKVLKRLYKETSLEYYYGINFTMLQDGRFPKTFTWKEMLQAHIDHEKEVYRRGFEFDLRKIKNRIHIIDGILICLANITEVVKIIKESSSAVTAAAALQKNFLLDETQAKAVLDMKLSRLAHLEVQKLEDEKRELEKEEIRITSILNDEQKFNQELINGWQEVATKFGDERRTKILNLEGVGDEPIERKQLQISLTNKNNIFTAATSTLYTQKRGGVGNKAKLENGEYIINSITVSSTDKILFFTSKGNVYHSPAHELNIDEKTSLYTLFSLKEDENVCAIINNQTDKKFICFITKNGLIKKSLISEYNMNRQASLRAINLDDGDEIVSVLFTNSEKIGILTEQGNFLMFKTEGIRPIGRIARGVIAIKLNTDDYVIEARAIDGYDKMIVSISGEGLIKKTDISEFAIQGRGTKGTRIQKLNDGDWMAAFLPLKDGKEVLITSTHSCIRISLNEVPQLSKGALGNKAMKLTPNSNVINLSLF